LVEPGVRIRRARDEEAYAFVPTPVLAHDLKARALDCLPDLLQLLSGGLRYGAVLVRVAGPSAPVLYEYPSVRLGRRAVERLFGGERIHGAQPEPALFFILAQCVTP